MCSQAALGSGLSKIFVSSQLRWTVPVCGRAALGSGPWFNTLVGSLIAFWGKAFPCIPPPRVLGWVCVQPSRTRIRPRYSLRTLCADFLRSGPGLGVHRYFFWSIFIAWSLVFGEVCEQPSCSLPPYAGTQARKASHFPLKSATFFPFDSRLAMNRRAFLG